MLKISTMFQNKIPTTGLIFKDGDNKAVNVIYFPELPNQGIDFINLYRKKNYWAYVIIPKGFNFMGHKILGNKYYKNFKKEIPQVRIQRKFTKVDSVRSVVIDLTLLSEEMSAFAKSRSKKLVIESFLELVTSFAKDNSSNTSADIYLLIDGNNTDEKETINALLYYSRLNGNKLRLAGVAGILLYGNKRFWPMTIQEEDKQGKYLKVNLNILSRFMKEVHSEDIDKEEETPEESIQNTKKTVEMLYKAFIGRKTKVAETAFTDDAKKAEDIIEEDPLDLIKTEVIRNKYLKGKTFEEKLGNLFAEKTPTATKAESEAQAKRDKKIPDIVTKINENLKELNKTYNGVIEVKEQALDRNSKNFYKPLNIIGFNDFHAYGKQKAEFGKNLDQSIHDLIMSIEEDKELGIKVLDIRTEITDNYSDRFKTYKVKIQHKNFGHTKPYTVSFHVPIPSKGKYLKIGGNEYIPISQFFSKPVIKVSPKRVRVYTHYSTCSIHLKNHALNDKEGIDSMIENMADYLKSRKKLKKKPQIIETDDIERIKSKYNLPDTMNSNIFVNLEIKE